MIVRNSLMVCIVAVSLAVVGCSESQQVIRFEPASMPRHTLRVPKREHCSIPVANIDKLFESPDELDTVEFNGHVFAPKGKSLSVLSGYMPAEPLKLMIDFKTAAESGDTKGMLALFCEADRPRMAGIFKLRAAAIHEDFAQTTSVDLMLIAATESGYLVLTERHFTPPDDDPAVIRATVLLVPEADGLRIREEVDYDQPLAAAISRLQGLPHGWIRKILTDAEGSASAQ